MSLARLLDGCGVEPPGFDQARRAGSLRRSFPSDVGPVDATVVESAIRRGGAVVTSDRTDIERLAAAARRRFAVIDL